MKKTAAIVILFLVALLAWTSLSGASGMHVMVGDEEIGGPLGALVGIVGGAIGLLVAGVVMVVVGIVLALVFAGLGVMAIFGLALGAVVLAAALSPLMLPLLIPVGIVWFFVRRNRRMRMNAAVATASA